ELRLCEIRRRLAEDLVGPPQLTVFALELLEPLTLLARQTRPLPRIPLAPPNPAAQRLGRTADLLCDRLDRRPFRFILVRVLADQPNRPLPHLRRVLLCSCHGSNFSRVGASGKPGAIQLQALARLVELADRVAVAAGRVQEGGV